MEKKLIMNFLKDAKRSEAGNFFELRSRYGMICHENNPILEKFPCTSILEKFPCASTELPVFSVWMCLFNNKKLII